MNDTKLNRRSYCQGMTQEKKDRIDGERDALRVIAGMAPFRPADSNASPAYIEGWTEVVNRLCPRCGTLADEDGYCVDPGCPNVGKPIPQESP